MRLSFKLITFTLGRLALRVTKRIISWHEKRVVSGIDINNGPVP